MVRRQPAARNELKEVALAFKLERSKDRPRTHLPNTERFSEVSNRSDRTRCGCRRGSNCKALVQRTAGLSELEGDSSERCSVRVVLVQNVDNAPPKLVSQSRQHSCQRPDRVVR